VKSSAGEGELIDQRAERASIQLRRSAACRRRWLSDDDGPSRSSSGSAVDPGQDR
jgi:hypothetical protein